MPCGGVHGTEGESGKEHDQNGTCQPLEVDDGSGQEGLDLHVGGAPPDGVGKSMLGLCLAMNAFNQAAVAVVERLLAQAPAGVFAAGPQ